MQSHESRASRVATIKNNSQAYQDKVRLQRVCVVSSPSSWRAAKTSAWPRQSTGRERVDHDPRRRPSLSARAMDSGLKRRYSKCTRTI